MLGSVLITAAIMLGVYAIVETDSYGWGSPTRWASAPSRWR